MEDTTPTAGTPIEGRRGYTISESSELLSSQNSGRRSRSSSDISSAKEEGTRKSDSSGDDYADDSDGLDEPPALGRSQSNMVHDLCHSMVNPGLLYTDAAHHVLDAHGERLTRQEARRP